MSVVKINNMILTPLGRDKTERVLTALYERINMSTYRYQMMAEQQHLEEVSRGDYVACPHMNGYNYLMFLTVIDGVCHNLLISKKELKYYKHQNRMEEIKIYTFKSSRKQYYNDTILDGKIVRNGRGVFMVYDAYWLCGQDVQGMDIMKKHTLVKTVVGELTSSSSIVVEQVSRYSKDKTYMILEEKNANGFIFLPNRSGKWYIYVCETNRVDGTILEKKPETNESQQEFLMKRTGLPDVYELYWDVPGRGLVREGIAAVPNMRTSHWCRAMFKTKESHRVMCVRSLKFNKWIPLCQDVGELSTVLF